MRRIGRNAIIGMAIALLLLAYIVSLWSQASKRQKQLDEILAQGRAQETQVKNAESLWARVEYASAYYDKRPPVLEALRQITSAFKDEDKIWVTSFIVKESVIKDPKDKNKTIAQLTGTLMGKSADQQTALKLIDRLIENPKLSDVKQNDLHQADQRSDEWAFTINFIYKLGD